MNWFETQTSCLIVSYLNFHHFHRFQSNQITALVISLYKEDLSSCSSHFTRQLNKYSTPRSVKTLD